MQDLDLLVFVRECMFTHLSTETGTNEWKLLQFPAFVFRKKLIMTLFPEVRMNENFFLAQ